MIKVHRKLQVLCMSFVAIALAAPLRPAEQPAAAAFGQQPKVYIQPQDGFEGYLSAAILAKKLPLTVVLDQAQADYIVKGSWRESEGGESGNGSIVRPLRRRTNFSASILIVDPKTSAVIFAYSSQKSGTHDLSKQIAEDWAHHLRHEMASKKK